MRTVVSRTSRQPVAAYDSYAEAQRAVDHLSDSGFPVDKVAIVGQGLRYVEQVTGRLTTGRAALAGALQGALLGAFLGLLVGVIFTYDPNPAVWLLILYGLASGALIGAALGAALHLATGGTRDFSSVPGMEAERYEVVVDEDVVDRAAELLRSVR
ncbi:MAG: hypothetical protein QOG77_896 [Solirubrobacteraceae bacterium]|jgi:uncharacterized membrane protein|nr:hypothetical protein [Solirubrobacteraceae bacterium]